MSTVGYNKFIFSDEKNYRIKRHLLFWLVWGTYFSLVRGLNPGYFLEKGNFPDLATSFAQGFLRMLPQMVLVYPLLYFILPHYTFNGKYIKTWFLIITLLLITIAINAVLIMAIPWYEVIWLGSKETVLSKEAT